MPPANNIGIPRMVTSTIGVQTSCPNSPTYNHLYGDDDDTDICPKHFTDIHKCKLEDTFSKKQKPDDIQLQIIAMECNLLYKDVRDWFRKRRIKWMEDLVRNENSESTSKTQKSNVISNSTSSSSKCNDPNNNMLQKKQNILKHNNAKELKNSKNILANSSTRGQQDVATT